MKRVVRQRPAVVPAPPRADAEKSPLAEESPPARSLRATDIVVASLLMALGGLVVVTAVRTGIGWGSDGPESGFVPFWLATILISSCAVIVVQAAHRASAKAFATREQLERVLTVLLPSAAMVLLTRFVGIYVASALYMAFCMRWSGRHSWISSIVLPLSFSVLTFLVFERWFLVPLPKGPLEAWLGY